MKKLLFCLLVFGPLYLNAQVTVNTTPRTPVSGFANKVIQDYYLWVRKSFGIPYTSATSGVVLTTDSAGTNVQMLSNGNLAVSKGLGTGFFEYLPKTANDLLYQPIGGSGTIPASQGGTGFTSYTTGDLIIANSATSFQKRIAVAVGSVLKSTGVATVPVWGKVTSTETDATIATSASVPTVANYTASGNGSSTAIVITHGLTGYSGTSKMNVTALNTASAGFTYVTVSSTTFTINYTVAPANGTNNLSYTITSKP